MSTSYRGSDNLTAGSYNLSLESGELFFCDCSSGSVTVVLPSATISKANQFTFVKLDNTDNPIIILGLSGNTISGQSSQYIYDQYGYVTVFGFGSTIWTIISEKRMSYLSSSMNIVSGGAIVVNHGLGFTPTNVGIILQCVQNDGGFVVGDRLLIPGSGSASSTSQGLSLVTTNSTISIRFGSFVKALVAINSLTGLSADLNNSRWLARVYVRS